MSKLLVVIIGILLILAAITLAAVAACHHRVLVVEGVSGAPVAGAYVSVERTSSAPQEVGQTDADGRLSFWISPFPLPRIICAQSTFYAQGCVNAISLGQQRIELAVPSGTP